MQMSVWVDTPLVSGQAVGHSLVMERIPCSVPILTLNARGHLERLLPVLREAFDDVLIIDGNSTDGTVELARSLGVRVERQFHHDIPNSRITDYTAARLHSWSLARQDWIFLVDADETPTPELIERVRAIIAADQRHEAHTFPRLVRLPNGSVIQHAFFYPEYVMTRLFRRSSGVSLMPDRKVHERFVLPPAIRAVKQSEPFIHTWPDVAEFRRKLDGYASMEYDGWTGNATQRLRWIIWYNLRSAVGQLIRAIRAWVVGVVMRETVLPWAYTWPMIAYRFHAMRRGLARTSS